MKLSQTAVALGFLVIVAALSYQAGSAAQATDKAAKESLETRCARAQLRLAELALEKAQALNRKVPGTLTGATVARIADDVEYAKLQLQNVLKSGGFDSFQACLDRAEMSLKLADSRYKTARDANQRSPGVLQPLDLERWQLAAELARMRLEHGRSLATASPQAKLEFQLDLMSDELSQVKQQTYLLGQNRLGQF